MKKITLFSTVALLSLMALSTTNAFAAEGQPDGGVYNSNGMIEFKASEDPTDPVDPTDPENPIDPEDPTNPEGPNPGTQGPLSIDFASSFDFGIQDITSVTKTYSAAAQKYKDAEGNEKEGPNFVQITDNRGTETGWKLTVKQDGQFTSTTNEAHVLKGTKITLGNGNVVSASNSAKPTGETTVEINPDGAESKLMNATVGQGAGTYLLDWGTDAATGAESVSLEVPGSTTKYAEKYMTKLVWTLTDTPDNV